MRAITSFLLSIGLEMERQIDVLWKLLRKIYFIYIYGIPYVKKLLFIIINETDHNFYCLLHIIPKLHTFNVFSI